jgi:hypothetical protein
MRKWSWLVAPAIVIALAAAPAMAAKGGGKQTAGGAGSTIRLESYSDLRLGGYAGFDTNAVGLAGWEYPMVEVGCYQSGTLVYMELNEPGAEFLLGGASSDWLTKGGSANCSAILYAYGWKGGKESIRNLDAAVSFDALG